MIRPKWFIPVACVIFHRRGDSNLEFLLGKRKEKEAEGGKWGLVGGTGAFWEGAKNPSDFALREAAYDLKITMDPEELKHFTDRIICSRERLILEIYFSYKLEIDQEIEVTGNDKAPDDCRWFSMKRIKEMAKRGKIAFGNEKTLKLFEKQITREGQ